MARLIIHLTNTTITLEVDDINKINAISDFCEKELGAYHPSENTDELLVDDLSVEMSDKLHSLLFELGIF